jgi:hypothetical protein
VTVGSDTGAAKNVGADETIGSRTGTDEIFGSDTGAAKGTGDAEGMSCLCTRAPTLMISGKLEEACKETEVLSNTMVTSIDTVPVPLKFIIPEFVALTAALLWLTPITFSVSASHNATFARPVPTPVCVKTLPASACMRVKIPLYGACVLVTVQVRSTPESNVAAMPGVKVTPLMLTVTKTSDKVPTAPSRLDVELEP